MVMPSLNSQNNKIKFLCSHGGKILPRYSDGKLRYHGGETRVLSVDRSISFSELLMKTAELYGAPVNLRCQLPTEDLDPLISITSDEDLENLIEEYDRAAPVSSSAAKIRAFLSLPRKRCSPRSSISSNNVCSPSPPPPPPPSSSSSYTPRFPPIVVNRCNRRAVKPPIYPTPLKSAVASKNSPCAYHVHNGNMYLVHNGNYRK